MARGDAWRLMAGVYIPNSRFLIDSDFDPLDAKHFPDGWSEFAATSGVTTGYANGFSDHRALRIDLQNTAGQWRLRSSRSPAGSVPIYDLSSETVRFRMVFWFKRSGTPGNHPCTPQIEFRDTIDQFFTNVSFATVPTGSSTVWTKYEAEATVNISNQTFFPQRVDAALVELLFGSGATPSVYVIDDITIGYRLTNPNHGSQAYDVLTARPMIGGLSVGQESEAGVTQTALRQLRVVDPSGGLERGYLTARFETARSADVSIWEHAYAHTRGLGIRSNIGMSKLPPPVVPGPIVIEPFFSDGATQSEGPAPENFYALMMQKPRWEPVGFLGNVWRGDITLEEVG